MRLSPVLLVPLLLATGCLGGSSTTAHSTLRTEASRAGEVEYELTLADWQSQTT